MTAKTLERTTFTPTKDPSVWYAGSRSRPGVTYRIERVGYPDMWCACPATKRCAHLKELADMLALVPTPAPAPKDEWNDITPAPVRAYFFAEPTAPPVRAPEPPKEASMNAPESTGLTVIDRGLATRNREDGLSAQLHDPSKQKLLRDTITTDLTQPEFDLFIEVCAATGLNPFMRQIHAIKRGSGNKAKMTIQTGIDGYRLLAQRTGQYDGQDGPYWCGEDGAWKDVWLSAEPPVAAKVTVYRKDMGRGFTGIARFEEFAQYTQEWQNGQSTGRQVLNSMWGKMPAGQTAKCAEALALRKAFPAEMSGIYTEDEMGQADNPVRATVDPAPERAAKPTYPWSADFKAALADSPFEMADVYAFLDTDRDGAGAAIDALIAFGDTPATIMTSIGRWADAGRKHPAAIAAPDPFDEAEYIAPSAEAAQESLL